MLIEEDAGKVVTRNRAGTKNHRLQSVIAGRAVTTCGLQMPDKDASGRVLLVFSEGLSVTCRRGCQ